MPKRHKALFAAIWFLLAVATHESRAQAVAFAQPADNSKIVRLTLEKAVAMALDRSPAIKIATDNEGIAAAEIRRATSLALPHLSIQSSYSRNIKKPAFFARFGGDIQRIEIGSNNAYSSALNFNQIIYENGQLGLGKARQATKLASKLTRENTRATRNDVVFQVRQNFYAVLLARETVKVFEQTVAQAEAHYKNLQAQFASGVAAEFDLLRSEVQLAEARPALIAAENNYVLAQNALKNTIGLPLDTAIEVTGELVFTPIPESDVRMRSETALAQRPEIRQLELQEQIAELNVAIQKGGRMPSISLNANYLLQGQSNDFQFDSNERNASLATTLNVKFNLFDGFETSAKIQKARAELDRVRDQREQLSRAIRIEILQTRQRMQEALERIEAQQKSVQQAEKAHAIAEVRYQQGVGTQLELFDARLALNRIKTAYLRAIYDYNVAIFAWQKAVGITN